MRASLRRFKNQWDNLSSRFQGFITSAARSHLFKNSMAVTCEENDVILGRDGGGKWASGSWCKRQRGMAT